MSIKELEVIDGVAQYDLIVIGSGSGEHPDRTGMG